MRFHDEVMAPADIDAIPTGRSAPRAQPAEVKMAGQIIDSMSRDWDPKRYEDTYRVQVLDYLKKKAAGEEIVVEEEPEEQSKVVDLMAALEASLDAAKKTGSRRTSKRSSSSSKKAPARKAPARKAPAKKTSSTSRRSSSGSKRKSA
jgi:DNA end-binding protein Ku